MNVGDMVKVKSTEYAMNAAYPCSSVEEVTIGDVGKLIGQGRGTVVRVSFTPPYEKPAHVPFSGYQVIDFFWPDLSLEKVT